MNFDAVLFRGAFDARPCLVTIIVGNPFDLIEAGHGVADVIGVVERLLTLLRDRELVLVDTIALGFGKF